MTGGVHEHMRAWDPEEDNIIITLLGQLGPKWSRIVQQLPGRTVSSVRNRWQRIEKGRKLREAGQESKNRCQRCGQPKRGHVCNAKLRARPAAGDGEVSASPGAHHGWDFSITTGDDDASLPRPSRMDSGSSSLLDGDAALDSAAAADPPRTPASDGARDDAELASEWECEAVPMLGRLKSAGRICSELGFEALAAAAMQVSAREQAATLVEAAASVSGREKPPEGDADAVCGFASGTSPGEPPTMVPLQPSVTRQMSDAPPLPPFGRAPSLFGGAHEVSADARASAATAAIAAAADAAVAAAADAAPLAAAADAAEAATAVQGVAAEAVSVEEASAAPIDLDAQISSGSASSNSSVAE